MAEFFEEINKEKMGVFEYNTEMANVCVLNAINAYHRGDGAMMTFFKNAEIAFRARAMESECQITRERRTMKSLRNWKSGILARGTITHFGLCIQSFSDTRPATYESIAEPRDAD